MLKGSQPPHAVTDHPYEPVFGFCAIAERLNGRLAMLGFIVAIGTYATTGQILPGVF